MGSIRKPTGSSGFSNEAAQLGELTIIDGKYQLIRRIAVGGASEVYEARHIILGTELAVKIMLPQFVGDPEALVRMKREASLTAKSKTENVLKALDAGMVCDRFYIITEFLKGCDLRQLLARNGPLELGKALYIINEAAVGVAWAHANWKAAHRDLKPENIHVSWDYDVKILDFGIAKLHEKVTADRCITDSSRTPGTLPYICPAVLRGARPADYLSDVFALGVVSYEILAGRHPGATGPMSFPPAHEQREFQLRWEIEPLTKLRPDIPESLALVIHKACAKEPEDRYQTIREFQKAILVEHEKLQGPHHVAIVVPQSTPHVDVYAPEWATDDTTPGVPAMPRKRSPDNQPPAEDPPSLPSNPEPRDEDLHHLPRPSGESPLLPDTHAESHPAHVPPSPMISTAPENTVVLHDAPPPSPPPVTGAQDPMLAGQVLPTSFNANAKSVLVDNAPMRPMAIQELLAGNWFRRIEAAKELRRLWIRRSTHATALLGSCVLGVFLAYAIRRAGIQPSRASSLSSRMVQLQPLTALEPAKAATVPMPPQPVVVVEPQEIEGVSTPTTVPIPTTTPAAAPPVVEPVRHVATRRRSATPTAAPSSDTALMASARLSAPGTEKGRPAKPATAANHDSPPSASGVASSSPPTPPQTQQPFGAIRF